MTKEIVGNLMVMKSVFDVMHKPNAGLLTGCFGGL